LVAKQGAYRIGYGSTGPMAEEYGIYTLSPRIAQIFYCLELRSYMSWAVLPNYVELDLSATCTEASESIAGPLAVLSNILRKSSTFFSHCNASILKLLGILEMHAMARGTRRSGRLFKLERSSQRLGLQLLRLVWAEEVLVRDSAKESSFRGTLIVLSNFSIPWGSAILQS
jgi:hypothetical protein